MTVFPTGEQYAIRSGDHEAVVTEVGATLRAYAVGGRDRVHGFAATETVKGGRGQQLIPWPNRIRDGRYTFGGTAQQLALTEPARHNASHGLARYVPWRLVEHAGDRVSLSFRIFPQPGWAGVLDATLDYRVDESGLTVTVTAENVGDQELPFGYAAHPYLTAGEDLVDELTVTVPAACYLEVDDRQLPTTIASVDGTDHDLRAGRLIGDLSLDTAMTDLTRDDDERWRVRVASGDRQTELWADESFGWVQVFTGGPYRNWSLAVEPMTCGPDAFNPGPTHDALRVLAPGDVFRATWGIAGS